MELDSENAESSVKSLGSILSPTRNRGNLSGITASPPRPAIFRSAARGSVGGEVAGQCVGDSAGDRHARGQLGMVGFDGDFARGGKFLELVRVESAQWK